MINAIRKLFARETLPKVNRVEGVSYPSWEVDNQTLLSWYTEDVELYSFDPAECEVLEALFINFSSKVYANYTGRGNLHDQLEQESRNKGCKTTKMVEKWYIVPYTAQNHLNALDVVRTSNSVSESLTKTIVRDKCMLYTLGEMVPSKREHIINRENIPLTDGDVINMYEEFMKAADKPYKELTTRQKLQYWVYRIF